MWDVSILCLLIMFIVLKKKRMKVFRRWWRKPAISEYNRNVYGAYSTIFLYFKLHDHEEFFRFTGITLQQFEQLYELVEMRLLKRSNRHALTPELQLAAVLNFLVNGKSISQSSWFFRIDRSTMYKLVPEVCRAIVTSLKEQYLSFPNGNDWLEIANGIYDHFDFPNCLGIIDGKHFRIKRPANSGSWFYNFKKIYSIVFMGTCDAYLRFTWFNVGDFGCMNDAGVFNASNLGRALETNTIRLPQHQLLPNSNIRCPYFFIGDGGFPLKPYLLKPYRRVQNMTVEQKVFNIRLSRVRKTIERAFGIICKKIKIFEFPIDWKLETSTDVII